MKGIQVASIFFAACVGVAGCSTWDKLNDTERGAVIGGGTGALVGGAVEGGTGAVVGGAAGALGGGLIGHEMEERDRDRHRHRYN